MELFGPTLLTNFPLKKSDFLGIFKNVLTGFYYICEVKVFHEGQKQHAPIHARVHFFTLTLAPDVTCSNRSNKWTAEVKGISQLCLTLSA
jgi:hypothetical protein